MILHPPPREPDPLHELGGSRYPEVNSHRINQAVQAQWIRSGISGEELEALRLATAYTMAEIGPRDEIEGMLVVQMVAAHAGAMECYRRAMIPSQSDEGRNQNLKFADRLTRTYAELVAALQKYRGKGQQHVTVKHVHVTDGGQAIVGNVQSGAPSAAGGGGGAKKCGTTPCNEGKQ